LDKRKGLLSWVLISCLVSLLVAINISPKTSVCCANYYQLKKNSHFISLGVKGYQQTTDYTCGPAAIMSLLHWYKILDTSQMNHATEMRIADEMGTGSMNSSHPGTNLEQMMKWLQNNGFQVTGGENGSLELIKKNLQKGIPVLVEWIDWGGHWVVVTGYYAESKRFSKNVDTIFFADSATHWSGENNPEGISSFNAWRFQDMWFDAQYLSLDKIKRKVYLIAIPSDGIIYDRTKKDRKILSIDNFKKYIDEKGYFK